MAEALVTSTITKLKDLAIEEWQIQRGISNDINFISNELSMMKATIRDAEKIRVRYEVVNQWLELVRDEAYKIEDVIEEFQYMMESSLIESGETAGGCLNIDFCIHYVHTFFKQMGIRHQFHSQIEIIKKEVDDIDRMSKRYNLPQEGTGGPDNEETRGGDHGVSNPFVEEDDIIGIDQDVNKLRKWLLKEEEVHRRSIVSVVGMGGSGKTTLVKKLYKSISEEEFECKAWVSVSQDFQVMDLLKRIVQQLHESRNETIPGDVETMTQDKLYETMYNYLKGKRYVLVLDDIWNVNAWGVVKNALPPKNDGRIIFTTRDQDVASPIGEIFKIHRVEPLPHKLAWNLFCRKAFKSGDLSRGCPEHLKEIGEEIVKRCGGLPLAVVVIGGLMSKKGSNISEWIEVLENLNWQLKNNKDLKRLISGVLLASYNYLPPYLKDCFLYCGMFPEDYEIKKSRLIRLWVAEGLIEDHPPKTLEEVAHGYLVQLLERNMLQAATNESYQVGLVGCRMHDLMRDMAIHLIKKEHFGEIFTKKSDIRIVEGQRRVVAIQNSSDSIPSNTFSVKTRSFLTFNVHKFFPLSVLETIFKSIKRLRVLDLSGSKIKHLPSNMDHLIHLRYLSVRRTGVNELPDSLYELQNLQTLDARNTFVGSFLIYPQLRHLLFTSWLKEARLSTLGRARGRGSNSSNLQTLGRVVLDESLVSQLCYLTQLRKLKLLQVKEEYCLRLCKAVEKMQHLRSLSIESSRDEDILDLETNMSSTPTFHLHLEKLELVGVMKEGHLPQWTHSLKCLQTISLSKNDLMEDPLNTFAQLPNLEVLILGQNTYLGTQIGWGDTSSSSNEEQQLSFPKLKLLGISSLPELEELSEIEDGMMPSLKVLHIRNCPKLKKFPHGFQHLKSLHELHLRKMPKGFIERLRRHHHPRREGKIVVESEGEEWTIE